MPHLPTIVVVFAMTFGAGAVRGASIDTGYPAPKDVRAMWIPRASGMAIIDSIGFDAEGLVEARAAYAGYAGEFTSALEAWKQTQLWVDSIQPSRHGARDDALARSVMDDTFAMEAVWQREARALEQAFFDELASIGGARPGAVARAQATRRRQRILATMAHRQRVVGVDLDVEAVVMDVIGHSAGGPGLDAVRDVLAAHHAALDPLLDAFDTYSWRRRSDLRRDVEALQSAVEREQGVDTPRRALVEGQARFPEIAAVVRGQHESTVAMLLDRLGSDDAERFRRATDRRLNAFLYLRDGVDDALGDEPAASASRRGPAGRIRSRLQRGDLTDEQRESLEALHAAIEDARSRMRPRLRGLYTSTIDPERARAQWRWHAAMIEGRTRGSAPELSFRDPGSANEQAYAKLHRSWRDQLTEYAAQLDTILREESP